jgi:6-phosphogluconate dehydrogenase
LVGWAQEALAEDPDLKEISSEIKSSGEGEWTVNTAKELSIDTPVLDDSVKVRQNSINDPEDSPEGFRNKLVSAQRGKFGHHPVKK